jgi:hypothetical protein
MRGRIVVVLLLAVGVLVTVFVLSAAAHRHHWAVRETPSGADVVRGRSETSTLPAVPEHDGAPPVTSPSLTY